MRPSYACWKIESASCGAATEEGVSCFDGTAWRTYTTADGLPGPCVGALAGDRQGHLWFGTQSGGATSGRC
jgi:ligand-binding sensor domain-containing protein